MVTQHYVGSVLPNQFHIRWPIIILCLFYLSCNQGVRQHSFCACSTISISHRVTHHYFVSVLPSMLPRYQTTFLLGLFYVINSHRVTHHYFVSVQPITLLRCQTTSLYVCSTSSLSPPWHSITVCLFYHINRHTKWHPSMLCLCPISSTWLRITLV